MINNYFEFDKKSILLMSNVRYMGVSGFPREQAANSRDSIKSINQTSLSGSLSLLLGEVSWRGGGGMHHL